VSERRIIRPESCVYEDQPMICSSLPPVQSSVPKLYNNDTEGLAS